MRRLASESKCEGPASAAPKLRYEEPKGRIEEALARIWSALLGIEKIGRNDNFFELGGNSLLNVLMLEQLRELGLNSNEHMFAVPTLSAFAGTIEPEGMADLPDNVISADSTLITPPMLPLISLTQDDIHVIVAETPGGISNIQDIYALSPLQEGILFHHVAASPADPYLLSSLVAFDNRTQLNGYLTALQLVIDRHDILRTAFHWRGISTPAQVVRRRATLVITEVTLDNGQEAGETQLRACFDPRRAERVNDFGTPGVMRLVCAQPARSRFSAG